MIKDLYNWTIQWAGTPFAGWALFFIAFAESSFFPFPPDLLLIPMCLANPENSFYYAGICTLGSSLGGVFGQGIGHFGGRPIARKMFSKDLIARGESLYKKYDKWAIAIAGFTPIPYKVFTILAGILGIRYSTLFIVSLFARGARFFTVATLLYLFGEPISAFIQKYFNILSIVFVVLLLGGFFAIKLFAKKNGNNQAARSTH